MNLLNSHLRYGYSYIPCVRALSYCQLVRKRAYLKTRAIVDDCFGTEDVELDVTQWDDSDDSGTDS